MIKTDIHIPFNYSDEDIFAALSLRLPVKKEEIRELKILKRSLDLTDKNDIHYTATVAISLSEEREAGLLKMKKKVSPAPDLSFDIPPCSFASRPLVVGAGPAGLFAALLLAEAGAAPILIDRGLAVAEREKKVLLFNALGLLDPECNIQFGEGGVGEAGTVLAVSVQRARNSHPALPDHTTAPVQFLTVAYALRIH